MFCERCGAELPQGAAFCPKCGAEQGKTELFKTDTNTQIPQKPFGAEIEKIYFDISDRRTVAESKGKKAPFFFVAGLVAVLIAVIIVFVHSVLGQGSAKEAVKAAMEKTIQTLQEEGKEGTSKEKQYGYFLEITGEYNQSLNQSSEIEEILEELGDLRILFCGNLGEEEDTYGSIEVGIGDMKNIRLNYCTDETGIYLSLPDLYDRSFFVPKDLLEDTTGADIEEIYDQKAGKEAFLSLGETFSGIYQELYTKVECAKIGKETLTEHGNIQTTCYELTILATDYQSYLNSLPDRLEEDQVFWDWLAGISSRQQVNALLNSLRRDIAQYQISEDIGLIILGSIYVDQQGRVVQLRIPYEDEVNGELVVSFLGEEKLSDYISIWFDMEDDYNTQTMAFRYQIWDEDQIRSIAVDKKNNISMESDQDEFEEAVLEILYHISDGGYLPSQYMDSLDEYLLSLEMYENYEDYDWEEDLNYSERGNPILEDYDGNYQIELIAPPESMLDLDWSYSTQICFMDIDEEQDYYYEIVELSDDTTDRFAFERTYMSEEMDYKNVVFSDIMKKEINGYQVYYQYCSYNYADVIDYKTYYAWVRLDEKYVFELYLDDYTNSVEDDILDGCFQAVLPIK